MPITRKGVNNFNYKHGMKGTRIYNSWRSMKTRCLNKNNYHYKNWGGRGITICEEWLKFENFYKDMGEMPESKTLDRIDNDLGYCKKNCKWSTNKEQCNNRRNNILLTYQEKTMTASQWAKELKIKLSTIYCRIHKNWDIKKVLLVKKYKR